MLPRATTTPRTRAVAVTEPTAPVPPPATDFYTVTPCRVIDTRNAVGPSGGPILGANTTRSFPVTGGTCGIPSTAIAVSVSLSAVQPAAAGLPHPLPGCFQSTPGEQHQLLCGPDPDQQRDRSPRRERRHDQCHEPLSWLSAFRSGRERVLPVDDPAQAGPRLARAGAADVTGAAPPGSGRAAAAGAGERTDGTALAARGERPLGGCREWPGGARAERHNVGADGPVREQYGSQEAIEAQ